VGAPCADRHRIALVGDVLLAAVADGAGSASRGEEGAETACGYAVELLRQSLALRLPEGESESEIAGRLVDVLEQVNGRLVSHARASGQPTRDYATTLLVAVARPNQVAVAQVGDGAAVILADGLLEPLLLPESGEYANETHFVTGGAVREHARARVRTGKVDAFCLLTDGLLRLAIDTVDAVAHQPFFLPLFRFAGDARRPVEELERELTEYLRSARISDDTDDDVTLVLATQATRSDPA
jgi:hypothetical protein